MSRQHGTVATYNRGCRCDDCRDACSHYRKQRRVPAQFPYPPANVDWHTHALCRTDKHPTAMFFPDGAGHPDWQPALEICRACPVINECLDYALEYRELEGVWGGKTPRQRRRILEKWRTAEVAS